MPLCCWGGGVVGYSADVFVLLEGTVLMSWCCWGLQC